MTASLQLLRHVSRRSLYRDPLLCVLLLALLTVLVDDFHLGLMTGFLGLALAALSLAILWGYTGVLSFGQAAFFGAGAYVFALVLTKSQIGPLLSMLLGIGVPVVVALLVGVFVFYSRVGLFFIAVITLALSVILEELVNQFSTFTGGFNGISVPFGFSFTPQRNYLIVVGLFSAILLAHVVLVRSDFGRVLMAIRDQEERARFLGYNTPLIKTAVLAISAGVAAIGGMIYAFQTLLVSPTLLGFGLSTQIVIWAAIGGRATLLGPVVGALAINTLQQELSGIILAYWQLALGIGLIMVVLFLPTGTYPALLKLVRVREERPLGENVVPDAQSVRQDSVGETILSTNAVTKWFGSFAVLRDISIDIGTGELVCLIGPNGAGKSTLLDVLTARVAATEGSVTVNGRSLDRFRPERLVRHRVARTFQTTVVFDSLSVFDNLVLAANRGRLTAASLFNRTKQLGLPAHVVHLLEASGLDRKFTESAESLAHGDRQWLDLCMALAQRPRILLLDEPTAGLTNEDRRQAGEVLRDLVANHAVGIVLVEHDLEFVREVADRVIVLQQGEVVARGAVDDVAANAIVRDIYLGGAA